MSLSVTNEFKIAHTFASLTFLEALPHDLVFLIDLARFGDGQEGNSQEAKLTEHCC